MTGEKRSHLFPDVPTMAQSGIPDYVTTFWTGVVVPAGTPQAVLNKLHQETAKVLSTEDVRQKLANVDAVALGGPPAEFMKIIRAEVTRLAPVLKKVDQ